MTNDESAEDNLVVRGARTGTGPGYTLEAAAVRLATDITEVRDHGGIPSHVRTVITVLPQQRMLEIRVEGLTVEADRTTIREITNTLFALASDHNIATLDTTTPPLFTQRILIMNSDGLPFHAMLGACVGTVTPQQNRLVD